MQSFSPKAPDERVTIGIGFRHLIAANETLSVCTFKAYDSEGVDSSDEILDGSPDTTAWPMLKHWVQGGELGKTYVIEATVETSAGRILIGAVKLPVILEYVIAPPPDLP